MTNDPQKFRTCRSQNAPNTFDIYVYIYNIHIVVVGIGQQPALHRSEVVKTPLLPSSGAATPHMTGETSQQSNLKIKSPQ